MSEKRQSGIELLRIIAMFLILVQHANGLAIGLPGAYECVGDPIDSFSRIFIQSLAIVGVDVFVLISGWFGISFNLKRLGEFLFQCLFFSIIVTFAAWLINGRPEIGIKSLAGMIFLGKSYWFVKCYLLLYILSPVLNSFINTANKKDVALILFLFLAVMLFYGWPDSMPEFNFGASSVSFIGLYLLARYVKKYCQGLCSRPMWHYAGNYFLVAFLLAAMSFVLYRQEAPIEITRCIFSYVNPLIIAGALSLVLLFAKMDFTSFLVNQVARSSFSVYLFHCGPIVWALFLAECGHIYHSYSGIGMLSRMLLFLLAVFAIAVIIDQIRLFLSALLFRKKQNE